MNCSPTSQIDNIGEEEMDASTTHHKRKVDNNDDLFSQVNSYMLKAMFERDISQLSYCMYNFVNLKCLLLTTE